MDKQELMGLKTKIETAKSEVSEKKGLLIYLMKELKDKWKCDTIDQGEAEVEKMQKEINELSFQIGEEEAALEKKVQSWTQPN